jgi:N-methylhydantoinase A
VKRDYVRSVAIDPDLPGSTSELRAIFDGLESNAGTWIASEGTILKDSHFEHVLDMRYGDQAYDLRVALSPALRESLDAAELRELFHQAHERTYNFRDLDTRVEITTARVRVVGKVPEVALPTTGTTAKPSGSASRRFYWDGRYCDASVHIRRELGAGAAVNGPAIIEQEDTTIVVLDGWRGSIDGTGNLIIERNIS